MTEQVAAVVLAGGLWRRMGGGDKMLLDVGGRTLLQRVIDRIRPQVGAMLLNINGDPARFSAFDLPIRPDGVEGYAGPLAGILTGLEWVRENHPDIRWLVSVAADTPLLPEDLVARLQADVTLEGADIGCAQSGETRHPVFGLWPVRLAADLRRALVEEDVRKIDLWSARYKVAHVSWPEGNADPFFNINTPEDIIRFDLLLKGELPAHPPLFAALPLSVLVERTASRHPWGTDIWRPTEVLPAPPEPHPWQLLRHDDDKDVYLAGALSLELHRSDLASYRYNLASQTPLLFVVLRPSSEGIRVLLVTAAPDEAQSMMEGEDMIEAVPMPDVIVAWIIAFAAQHPPDIPVKKRKRDNYDPDKAELGRRPDGDWR